MPFKSPKAPSFRTRTLLTLALGLGALSMPGCWYTGWHEGGDMNSRDKHVYISTAWQPKTITLVDTRSGEAMASWDVPVGRQLAMQFYDEKNSDDPVLPAILRYEIMVAGQTGGTLTNSMPSPGRDARRLDVRLRPVPEYPPEDATASRTTSKYEPAE
jgi:hypothetical protein